MSIINIYTYDRKTAAKIPDTVNLVIQAKQSETGEKDDKGNKVKAFHPNLTETVYFSAPVIGQDEIADNIVGLLPFIKGMLCEAQKGIVKAQILEKGAKSIDSEAITVSQCIRFMSESDAGKITEDYVKAWFAESIESTVREWIIAGFKWGDMTLTDVMTAQLDTRVNMLRDIMAICATTKVTDKKQIDSRHYKPILALDNYLTEGEKSDAVYTLIRDNCVKSRDIVEAQDNLWSFTA